MPNADALTKAIERHIIHGDFMTSTGPANKYVDVVSAIINNPRLFRAFYMDALEPNLWPVAPGASGALILGLLAPGRPLGTLWRGRKGYGLEFHNPPPPNTKVALVDDCSFTGATLRDMKAACEAIGLVVVKEVVAADFRPF